MEEPFDIEKYTLSYRPTKTKEVGFLLEPSNAVKSKALKYPHRLIYIVKHQNEFLYVGEAKAELNTRFERGFSSYRYFKRYGKARGGYKGYKWIKLIDPLEGKNYKLEVWAILFSSNYQEREQIEAIEGELVYHIRSLTGRWPRYQNEIHFNNEWPEAPVLAIRIFQNLT